MIPAVFELVGVSFLVFLCYFYDLGVVTCQLVLFVACNIEEVFRSEH